MRLTESAGSLLYRGVEFFALNIGASHKVTLALDYRRRWQKFLPLSRGKSSLWIHGSSVGELEDLAAFFMQPELLKEAGYSPSHLVLTSSSPSAESFLIRTAKSIKPLYAGPLPPDVSSRIIEFFDFLDPDLLILSQNDTWPVLLSIARDRLKYGALWLPHKNVATSRLRQHLLAPLVRRVGLRRSDATNPLPDCPASYIGIARLDRILERIHIASAKPHPLEMEIDFSNRKRKLLIGSAWKEDTAFLKESLDLLAPEERHHLECFAIPHDCSQTAEITAMKHHLGKALLLKEGILLEAFQNFDMVMMGGAFRTGLHNVLEPLAWGIPTFCGPQTSKQPEAPRLVEQGSLKIFSTPSQLASQLQAVIRTEESFLAWRKLAQEIKQNFEQNRGASQRLANVISEMRASLH